MKTLREMMDIVESAQINEFAPGNGADDNINPKIAANAEQEGKVKGISLADGADLDQAFEITGWDTYADGIYKEYFASGFMAGRKAKIQGDATRHNIKAKLLPSGEIKQLSRGGKFTGDYGLSIGD